MKGIMPNQDINEIAKNFFFVFARMEYSLKVNGYLRECDIAWADWRKYSRELKDIFNNPSDAEFIRAIDYYENNPPKVQIVRNNVPVWEDKILSSGSRSEKLIKYICRVRNNLFHGGKFRGVNYENPDRSELLISHALIILDRCKNANANISEAFSSQ
jgi:hypothetical protein